MAQWIDVALGGALLGQACLLLLLLVMLRNQLTRYEKFRLETAELMSNFSENLIDINARLTAAGYPPGRVLPATSYPGWATRQFGGGL